MGLQPMNTKHDAERQLTLLDVPRCAPIAKAKQPPKFYEFKLSTVRVFEDEPAKCDQPDTARDYWNRYVAGADWFSEGREPLELVAA